MGLMLSLALAQAAVPGADLPAPAEDPCALFERLGDQTPGTARPIVAMDLTRIADIGRSDPNPSASPFAVSPDGKEIAFLIRRANPQANAFCQRLMTAPMDGSVEEREIARGGELIRADFALRNFPSFEAGYAKVITPRWSPEGSRIAFLRREGGPAQVWLVDAGGKTPARQATAMLDDVDDFAWIPDGQALIVATRPALRLQNEAIAQEAREGFLFDDRFAPQFSDSPIPTGPLTPEYTRVDLASGASRPASLSEIALLVPGRAKELPVSAGAFAKEPDGLLAWSEATDPERLISPTRLVMTQGDGTTVSCEAERCSGTMLLWWSAQRRKFYALQKTGWAESMMQLLEWDPGEPAPRRVLLTEDVLVGCALADRELVCAREGSARPRRLVGIDLETGRERVIFDPNPGFGRIKLGKVQRLRFLNAYGVESYADLVLPPDHRSGDRHPLVVVQYISHGFLRGGTGDEVPVHVLAARGFAVLSFARPDFVASAMQARSEVELRTANRIDWIDRRSVQSSLEQGVALAIATGAVDQGRMGISGFSDGTSTVQWALINSSLFKTASLGACCEDIYSYPLAGGPAFTQFGRDMGYRFFEPGAEEFWRPMSLVLNADRIDVPILIQTGDSEYEIGLDVVEAFRSRGKAIELHVLGDEPHFKWQPAHRLAIYERSTEWFEFWLMHRMNCAAAKAAQYRRWKAMKGAPPADQLHCSAGTALSWTRPGDGIGQAGEASPGSDFRAVKDLGHSPRSVSSVLTGSYMASAASSDASSRSPITSIPSALGYRSFPE
ncbi:MAG: Atxe2 family lasso peptide isopeptidase [Alphaproteobacteria bacterium]|nr:Atxe2 family lasso peptide isopeptidase [Alphaproteobacteria bacterium]